LLLSSCNSLQHFLLISLTESLNTKLQQGLSLIRKYLLAIISLSVLIGTSASSSFQHEVIQRTINTNLATSSSPKYRPFIQTYSSHPFLDVYGVECDKGLAFDNVLSQLKQKEREGNVMYLGDSENDNLAFRKSDISIGIRSDARLNPKLDCKYMLNFNQLHLFLRGLIDNDFVFSEDLLSVHVD
jgi:hypothetical protein